MGKQATLNARRNAMNNLGTANEAAAKALISAQQASGGHAAAVAAAKQTAPGVNEIVRKARIIATFKAQPEPEQNEKTGKPDERKFITVMEEFNVTVDPNMDLNVVAMNLFARTKQLGFLQVKGQAKDTFVQFPLDLFSHFETEFDSIIDSSAPKGIVKP